MSTDTSPEDSRAGHRRGALATMAAITARATGRTRPPAPAPADAPPPAVPAGGPELDRARVLLSEQNALEKTRLALLKRVALRGSRLFTHKLVAAGQAITDAVQAVETTHGAVIAELQGRLDALVAERREEMARRDRDTQWLAAEVNRMRPDVAEVSGRVDRRTADLDRVTSSLHARLSGVELTAEEAVPRAELAAVVQALRAVQNRLADREKVADHDRAELHRTRTQLGRLQREQPAAARVDTAAATPADGAPAATLDDSTYVDFEHRFRGTRDEIRARQQDALTFVHELGGGSGPLLDLGCGRGEWLELVRESGIDAYGVDNNTTMVREATQAGLDVRLDDVLTHLAGVEPSSLQVITAFHLAEHVPLPALAELVDNALLALRPGGLLLLETPNPTNLAVGAASFFLDPTHLRVLHPDFLAFLVESRGFVDPEIHFIHPVVESEALELAGPDGGYSDDRLNKVVRSAEWALFGPQDYLLAARRPAVAR